MDDGRGLTLLVLGFYIASRVQFGGLTIRQDKYDATQHIVSRHENPHVLPGIGPT